MSTAPAVRVVVLNWNAAWFTRRCLRSLEATIYPKGSLEVVLVDNASIDGSVEQMRAEFPDVRLIRNNSNLGFAEGCNRAMRDLGGVDFVALINNDAVVEPSWLEPAVDALADDPRAGAAALMMVLEPAFTRLELNVSGGSALLESVRVGGIDVLDRCLAEGVRSVGRPDWPMTLDRHVDDRAVLLLPIGEGDRAIHVQASGIGELRVASGSDQAEVILDPEGGVVTVDAGQDRQERLNGLGTDLNEVGEGFDRHYGEPLMSAAGEDSAAVQGFCGGGVLLRASMLRDVGLFDPKFFAYYEDTDLSRRAALGGWRTIAVPDSVIRHAFGGSAGSKARGFFFLNYRNWLLSVIRNGDRAQRRAALGRFGERFRWAIRANVLSPLKHLRCPDLLLVGEWLRVLIGVLARMVDIGQRRPPGAEAMEHVRSRLQPRPRHRPPASRPGGPLLVYVEVPDGSGAIDTEGPEAQLVSRLSSTNAMIDAVAVRASGTAASGYRRATPSEWARMLGLEDWQPSPVEPAELDLDVLDADAVFVGSTHDRPARIRSVLLDSLTSDADAGADNNVRDGAGGETAAGRSGDPVEVGRLLLDRFGTP